jgi:hypothetical protein
MAVTALAIHLRGHECGSYVGRSALTYYQFRTAIARPESIADYSEITMNAPTQGGKNGGKSKVEEVKGSKSAGNSQSAEKGSKQSDASGNKGKAASSADKSAAGSKSK